VPPERVRIPDRLPVRHPLHFKALSSTLGILDKAGLMKQPLENRGSVQKRGAPKAASIRSKLHQESRSLPAWSVSYLYLSVVERLFPHSQTREYRAPEEVFVRSVSRYDFETADKRGDEFRFRRSYFLISANAEFLGLRMKQLEGFENSNNFGPRKRRSHWDTACIWVA
jgi:hypothetical protein